MTTNNKTGLGFSSERQRAIFELLGKSRINDENFNFLRKQLHEISELHSVKETDVWDELFVLTAKQVPELTKREFYDFCSQTSDFKDLIVDLEARSSIEVVKSAEKVVVFVNGLVKAYENAFELLNHAIIKNNLFLQKLQRKEIELVELKKEVVSLKKEEFQLYDGGKLHNLDDFDLETPLTNLNELMVEAKERQVQVIEEKPEEVEEENDESDEDKESADETDESNEEEPEQPEETEPKEEIKEVIKPKKPKKPKKTKKVKPKMKPCPKCGELIEERFTWHGKCGWSELEEENDLLGFEPEEEKQEEIGKGESEELNWK